MCYLLFLTRLCWAGKENPLEGRHQGNPLGNGCLTDDSLKRQLVVDRQHISSEERERENVDRVWGSMTMARMLEKRSISSHAGRQKGERKGTGKSHDE